ncbi:hypothetical protein [Yinghuangia sp. YIM S09857]|uniref:hypothetical protein n=1 Tax=Yinghuangia sp. YIM S09857 TaxID=3436929 RepID=UPI003F52D0D0
MGRSTDRSELEDRARRALNGADLVMLCSRVPIGKARHTLSLAVRQHGHRMIMSAG